jgi:hypothetical protein
MEIENPRLCDKILGILYIMIGSALNILSFYNIKDAKLYLGLTLVGAVLGIIGVLRINSSFCCRCYHKKYPNVKKSATRKEKLLGELKDLEATVNLFVDEKDDLKSLNEIQEKANNIAIALKIKN